MNYNMMLTKTSATTASTWTLGLQRALSMAFASCVLGLSALMVQHSSAQAAPADDFKEASRLFSQGRLDQAMAKVNAGLQQTPKDAQGRFLRGLILTEQKKVAEAIQTFTGLTEDFPELPEPYNNLAVLYASQGNYDKAKAALELAIHTHPAYATAYENLGDIHAQLARRAYDKALQLDQSNTTAQSKLALVREMFNAPKTTQPPVAVAAASGASTVAAKADPAKAAPAAPAAATTASAPAASKPAPAVAANEEGVRAAVSAWARAWSARDVDAYLGFYAADFDTPDGLSRGAWEAQRRERIQRQKSIRVDVTFRSVTVKGSEATAVFRQSYKSDTVNSNNTKTLRLVRAGDKWLIKSERAGG